MFDLKLDPEELANVYDKKDYSDVRKELEKRLSDWLVETNDPWRCAPNAILEDKGSYLNEAQCLTLGHLKN